MGHGVATGVQRYFSHIVADLLRHGKTIIGEEDDKLVSMTALCEFHLSSEPYSAWVTPDWASTGNEEQASRQACSSFAGWISPHWCCTCACECKDIELCIENIVISKRKQTHKAHISFKWLSAAAARTAHFCQPLFFSSFATNSMSRSSTLRRVWIDPHPDKLYWWNVDLSKRFCGKNVVNKLFKKRGANRN